MDTYDLCIIGAGMYGCAAARHASANPAYKICLIGPNEPTETEKQTREIYSAHYDEGRIVHSAYPEHGNQVLARHSIDRFRELEKLSGIRFYYPVGTLRTLERGSNYYYKYIEGIEYHKVQVVDLSHGDIVRQRFPFLKLDERDYPIFDDLVSGYMSCRKTREAQKKVALLQGCHIIDDVVEEVADAVDGEHKIITKKGNVLKAKRILFCTGAFTQFKKFAPIEGLKIELIKGTAALLKIPKEEKDRLSFMPSMIMLRDGLADMPSTAYGAYILPPIQYPDGQWYLKIGPMGNQRNWEVSSLEEVKEWYNSEGDQEVIDKCSKFLISIIPNLKVDEIKSKTCLLCNSPSGLPYIDRVTPTVTVALVGNGRGATISDEVGRIAALLSLTGQWHSELSKKLFEAIFEEN